MVHKKKSLQYFDIMFLGFPRTDNPDSWARFFYFTQNEGYNERDLLKYFNVKSLDDVKTERTKLKKVV